MGHAQNGVVGVQNPGSAEVQREVPGGKHHFLPIGEIVVQIPSEEKVLRFVGCRSTHVSPLLSVWVCRIIMPDFR